MENKVKISITLTKVQQVGPDDWEAFPLTREIDDSTTIFDIRLWASEALGVDINRIDLTGAKFGKLWATSNHQQP